MEAAPGIMGLAHVKFANPMTASNINNVLHISSVKQKVTVLPKATSTVIWLQQMI